MTMTRRSVLGGSIAALASAAVIPSYAKASVVQKTSTQMFKERMMRGEHISGENIVLDEPLVVDFDAPWSLSNCTISRSFSGNEAMLDFRKMPNGKYTKKMTNCLITDKSDKVVQNNIVSVYDGKNNARVQFGIF